MSLTGSLKAYLEFTEATFPTTAETINRAIRVGLESLTFSDGTGDQAATKIWAQRNTLVATSTTLDLTALPLPNVSNTGTGSPVQSFSKIKILIVYPEGTDGQILYLGNAASTVWYPFLDTSTDRLKCWSGAPTILPNTRAQASNAWTVDASNKSLKIDSGAITLTYTLALVGV